MRTTEQARGWGLTCLFGGVVDDGAHGEAGLCRGLTLAFDVGANQGADGVAGHGGVVAGQEGAGERGWHAFRAAAAIIVAAVVLYCEDGGHTAGRAQTRSQVGGSCWVVGVHTVLRGHVVAGETSISMGHLVLLVVVDVPIVGSVA